MGKIIFLDVDGTLVDEVNRLSPSAVTAIRRARVNGHRVYLCTGRSRAEIYPELWEIGLDGMIGGNGSYVEDHGHVVFHRQITLEQCKRVVDWLHERKLEFYLESNNGIFASEHFEEAAEFAFQLYSKQSGAEGGRSLVRSIFPEMVFGGELYRDDINKISFLLSSYQDYLDAEAAFDDLHVGIWDEGLLFADFGVKDISKASAVQTLVNFLGADLRDTIAFGDARVDIPMLTCCGYGVAMGNGSAEIKAAADYVTAPVDQNGLYLAFETLGLLD